MFDTTRRSTLNKLIFLFFLFILNSLVFAETYYYAEVEKTENPVDIFDIEKEQKNSNSWKREVSTRDAKQHGDCEDKWSSGQKRAHGRMENGLKEGRWVYFHKNGKLWGGGLYKNGKKEGHWVVNYENGSVLIEEKYSEGKRDGYSTLYFQNGNKHIEANYLAGLKEGKWTEWYRSGVIATEGEYKSDIMKGTWLYFNQRGEKIREEAMQK